METNYHPIEIRNEANDPHNGESRVGGVNQWFSLHILRRGSRRKNQRVENARADSHSDRRVGRELRPDLSITRPPLNQTNTNFKKITSAKENQTNNAKYRC